MLAAGAGAEDGFSPAVRDACTALGARVCECPLPLTAGPEEAEAGIDAAVFAALEKLERIDMLVVDAAGLAARAPGNPLLDALEASWNVTRALANHAFIGRERGGRIVYLAPAPGLHRAPGSAHADATRAGLENLARTLSIEWARYAITTVTIAPAADTTSQEVASLIAYLASPAGEYFSGCLLDLRGPARR
jgi:NAD(P)-dependent dehydrogenase (short-subunit alcohol dehydrogenase family)